MSLLHDALKKAEKSENRPITAGVFVDGEGIPERRGIGLRIYVLLALAVAGLLIAIYFQFLEPRFRSGPGRVAAQPTPLGIAGGPGMPVLQEEAEEYLKEEKWSKARGVLEKMVILEPQNPESYNNLGFALKKLGEREAALEQYKKALALRPDYPEAVNNLGVLYLADKKFDEARGEFKRLLRLEPRYPEAYFHIGLIAEAQGRNDEARRNYQKFIELSKDLDLGFLSEIQDRIRALSSPG
ncbi:MAG: tetratricopeptide repeat protein [Deltaproteobacteria bacterium]|nr:tetratricopeptide repeat protein [Deltaproteobacteria bacterium]